MRLAAPDTAIRTHRALKSTLRHAILSGIYKPNDVLPGEEELAKHYRLSRPTVNRALQELAREGLVLRKRRSGTVVCDARRFIVGTVPFIFGDDITGGRATDFIVAASEILQELGLAVVPCSCHGSEDRARQLLNWLLGQRPAAVVLAPLNESNGQEMWRTLVEAGIPVVVAGEVINPPPALSFISTDHFDCGAQLARHLHGLGHRRFAAFGPGQVADARRRMDGFSQTLATLGVPGRNVQRFNLQRLGDLPHLLPGILENTPPPCALLGINDMVAMELMVALRQLGWRVPDDYAVVGVGGERWGKATLSPLTTVDIQFEEEAHVLAGLLVRLIRGEQASPVRVKIGGKLLVRESCGSGKPVRPEAPKPQTPNQKEACLKRR